MNLTGVALRAGRRHKSQSNETVNIIQFIEDPSIGLGLKLWPVQRIILKAHYGIPLDDTEKTVRVTDWRRENETWFTEAGYLRYLYDEGRSNIREVEEGIERREMVLSLGRRSGKTTISAAVVAYETYRLISKGNPQDFYGVPPGNQLYLTSLATGKDQASLLFNEVSDHFRRCSFFKPYTANNTMSYARFQTPWDIESFGSYADDKNAPATINVSFQPCSAKSTRGRGNVVIVLDEVAHFLDVGQTSAEEVYTAIKPSMMNFVPKGAPPGTKSDGRMILISSPLGKQGLFYRLFQMGFGSGPASKNLLCIQAPTWEVNPDISVGDLEIAFHMDVRAFEAEYGGEFTDRTRGWISPDEVRLDLSACIDPDLRPLSQAPARRPHFVGIDIGLVNDGSAVAIGHLDEDENIVVDFVDQIKAGEGAFENHERLDFDDVADWIYRLSKKFYMTEGIFDQWSGIPFEQALAKRGLKQLKSTHFTEQLRSDHAKNFKDMLNSHRLRLYNWPLAERPDGSPEEYCEYIKELLSLQETVKSKYVTIVEAPNEAGKHDDLSDALIRMVWCASQKLTAPKKILGTRGDSGFSRGGRIPMSPFGSYSAATMRRRFQSGSHPSRQIPRSLRSGIKGPLVKR